MCIRDSNPRVGYPRRVAGRTPTPVSYTHLDVYKRQGLCIGSADSTHVKGISVRGNVVFNANQNRQNDGVTRAKSCLLYTSRCV